MPKKWFQPEEIIGKLCHADGLLGRGKKIVEVVMTLCVTDVTSDRWGHELGGMTTAQAKRLKERERKNSQLRFPVSYAIRWLMVVKGSLAPVGRNWRLLCA